jgi:hypothetical protein
MATSPVSKTDQKLADLVHLNEDLRRLERELGMTTFYGDGYTASELSAKPMVLVIGQYSTGKTTLISSLCGGERVPRRPRSEKGK